MKPREPSQRIWPDPTEVQQFILLERFFASTPTGLFIFDHDLRVLRINRQAASLSGLSVSGHLGRTISEISPRLAPIIETPLRQVLAEGKSIHNVEFSWTLPGESGETIWLEASFHSLHSEEGEAISLGAIIENITNRKMAELNLRKEIRFSENVIESMPGIFFLLDTEARLIKWNKLGERQLGYSPVELRNKPAPELIAPQDRIEVAHTIERAFREGSASIEHHILTKDGQQIPCLGSGIRIEIDGENYICGLVLDISSRIAAEQALQERLRFETLLSNLSATFVDLPANEVDREIRNGLQQIVEFLGIERSTLMEFSEDQSTLTVVSTHASEGFTSAPEGLRVDQDLPWITERLRQGLTIPIAQVREGFPEEAGRDLAFFRESGLKSVLTIPLKVGGRAVGGIGFGAFSRERSWPKELVGRFQLVGEVFANALIRKRTEQSLLAEKQLSDSVIESLPGLFFMLDEQGRYKRWNKNTERVLGFDPGELRDCSILDFVSPVDLPAVQQMIQDALRKGMATSEFHVLTKDGQEIPYLGSCLVARIGPTNYLIGVEINISKRKLAEDALREAFSEIEALKKQLETECYFLREEIKLEHNFENIVGTSDALKYVLFKVEQVAPTDATVLLLGETGTGKELIARAIHDASPRNERPLVKVNCAALPGDLIESELFGHEKGSFTGAHTTQVGRFEVAHGATLFLDEIGELPPKLQAKLLRALQDGEFERLGSPRTIRVDVRVIAATNRNLEEEIKRGRFREDLWYRLNVFPITVPPLRLRQGDIPQLVHSFVNKLQKKLGKVIETIPQGVMDALQDHSWPGNVRELENVIERAMINSNSTQLRLASKLTPPEKAGGAGASIRTLQEIEHDYILQVLNQTRGKIEGKGGAAELLGLNPSTLRGRMRKLGIKRP